MTPHQRAALAARFNNCCAYCGRPLPKRWHADHIEPIFRGCDPKPERAGKDASANLVPACPRCNHWKATMTTEEFRGEITAQVDRLRRDSAGFRLAEDFGLVEATGGVVKFWFEGREG